MGILDFLKTPAPKEAGKAAFDPADLSRMQKGYSVMYEGMRNRVIDYAEYDWGEGLITQEWKLTGNDREFYLEREKDESVFWYIREEIDNSDIEKIFQSLRQQDDPPEKLTVNEKTFFLRESGAGIYCDNGRRPGKDCIMWSYTDKEESGLCRIYQWDDKQFSAYVGKTVSETDFSEILTE